MDYGAVAAGAAAGGEGAPRRHIERCGAQGGGGTGGGDAADGGGDRVLRQGVNGREAAGAAPRGCRARDA
eukprot:5971809-Prymnesium_polylepis.2